MTLTMTTDTDISKNDNKNKPKNKKTPPQVYTVGQEIDAHYANQVRADGVVR